MNQAHYRRSWPVYALLLAIMGFVTTLAAVEKQKKRTPLAFEAKKQVPQPNRTSAKSTRMAKTGGSKTGAKTAGQLDEKTAVASDSVVDLEEIQVSSLGQRSPYVVQQGNVVYWVITPRMRFKDLGYLKQDIEIKTGYTFDFTQIKFDPLQVYIDAIGVNVHLENGGSGSTTEGEENDKPIKSIGGYLSATERGSLGIGSGTSFDMPAALQRLVKEDEEIIARLVEEKRLAYFIQRNQKHGVGSSRTVKGDWLLANRGRRNEDFGVFIDADNRVQLYQPDSVAVLIDGKEVKAEEVTFLKPKQLNTVIVKDMRYEAASLGRKKRFVQLFLNP